MNKLVTLFLMIIPLASASLTASGAESSRKVRLGKKLFFDTNLSTPPGQACATCHVPTAFSPTRTNQTHL